MSKNTTSPTASDSPEPPLALQEVPAGDSSNLHRNIHVDGEAAESFIAEKRIGERIKHLRLKKSMGLVELGRHTGLSASFLSQLETARGRPTLQNLAPIASVFPTNLTYFSHPPPRPLLHYH